ncbi:MAG: FGGY family carbohydrate kinase [Bryobacteraceae bacterium]
MGTRRLPSVLGIDVGTSGIRLTAVDITGKIAWTGVEGLSNVRPTPDGIHEQDPREWWAGICQLTRKLRQEQPQAVDELHGVCVTSTSGTLVAVDKDGEPVRPAILYDDQRAGSVARELNCEDPGGGTNWTASHSFTKAIWLCKEEPRSWERVAHLLHPTDWLTSKLTGQFGFADHSSALKLGYEIEEDAWHGMVRRCGIPYDILPIVVRSGGLLGRVCAEAREDSGLPEAPVVAGATDGMAGLIASGASSCGDANTTLGTTLVWKVLSNRKPTTAGTNVYSHLHPAGFWVPGAASNTGPGSFRYLGDLAQSASLDEAAWGCLPSPIVCYPLSGKGERFPFANSEARAFATAEPADPAERHAAQLQALAFVERWGYDVLERCGVTVGSAVYSTGGAASSRSLSRLRASTLHRCVLRCAEPNAAFGAAILAASTVHYGGELSEAIRSMTHVAETNAPDRDLEKRLDEAYGCFQEECRRRGYCA